ncbi:MAG: WbqC family protein [bacterium]
MKLALMQPYFFPYIGYYQFINCVDEFILYDDVQYMKGGWINRNRILLDGMPHYITLPIEKKGNLSDMINEKRISSSREIEKAKTKILGQLYAAYRKAPFYKDVIELVNNILNFPEKNLACFLTHSIQEVCHYLKIGTRIMISSDIKKDDKGLSGQERVIAICKARNATHYINTIGGQKLYSKKIFTKAGIRLSFIKTRNIEYLQFRNTFVPFLSIVDVMMFNSVNSITQYLTEYDLI